MFTHAPGLLGLLIPTDIDKVEQRGTAEHHLAGCGRDQPTPTCIYKDQTRVAVVSVVWH